MTRRGVHDPRRDAGPSAARTEKPFLLACVCGFHRRAGSWQNADALRRWHLETASANQDHCALLSWDVRRPAADCAEVGTS